MIIEVPYVIGANGFVDYSFYSNKSGKIKTLNSIVFHPLKGLVSELLLNMEYMDGKQHGVYILNYIDN